MKRCLLLAALAAIHGSGVFAQPPTPNGFHVVSSGDTASVFFQDGIIIGSVVVFQCGVPQTQACMNYFVGLQLPPPPPPPGAPPPPPPQPIPLEEGGGFLPDGAFTGSFLKGALSVHVDTSTLTDPLFHRDVGMGGPISIDFVRTNDTWQHFVGVAESKFPGGLQIHSSGESTTTSATATGNVIAWPIPTAGAPSSYASATVGQNRGVQIAVQH